MSNAKQNEMKASQINSLLDFTSGTKCSIMVDINGMLVRRNGIVNSEIKHKPGFWCIEMTQRSGSEKYFNSVSADYFEILEPMDFGLQIESAFDELI